MALRQQIVEAELAQHAERGRDMAVGQATGQSEGLAELMVFYCECAAGFSNSVGYEDGVYFDALMRMFEQALKLSVTLPVDQRDVLLDRLDDVRRISHDFGYGLGDGMDVLFTSYGVDD